MAGKARWMRALWILGLLVAGAVSMWLLVTDPGTLSGLLAIVLWSALGIGVMVRLVRAPRGNKMRQSLGPVADAADSYQKLLTGREGMGESIRKSFPTDPGDRPGHQEH